MDGRGRERPGAAQFARAARTLAAAARALDGRDLARPEDAADSAVDVADLGTRADAAVKALTAVQSALKAALARAKPDDAVLSATLVGASAFGVAGAVPVGPALVAQAQSVSQEVVRRLALVKQAAKDADGHVARLHAVFGDEFLVLKRLVLPQAAAFASAFAGSAGLVGDPGAPVTWFHGASRVRDGVARLQAALTYAEALQTGASLSLRVAQLPAAAGERWVALPPAAGTTIPGGRLSLVAQAQPGLDLAKPVAGILIDEWVEVVPSAREVTGVAFHYDQPNAEPPQAILLAVAPDLRLSACRAPGTSIRSRRSCERRSSWRGCVLSLPRTPPAPASSRRRSSSPPTRSTSPARLRPREAESGRSDPPRAEDANR